MTTQATVVVGHIDCSRCEKHERLRLPPVERQIDDTFLIHQLTDRGIAGAHQLGICRNRD